MSRLSTIVAAAAVATFALGVTAGAHADDNWSNWRGPNYQGTTDADPPVDFSPTEKIKWEAEMPGPSAATPIIHDDHVFVSSADPNDETLWAIALDRETGEELWRHEAGTGYQQDGRSNYASPSPVTDGERVVFFYGTGDLVAYDFDGEQLWHRNIQADYGPFAFLWTFSTSPLLYDGKLYMQVLQRDVPVSGRGFEDRVNESYLLALDPETGEEIFRVIRPSEAVAESREAFTTPIPHTHEGRTELLIAGGDDLTGHDLETGEELWRWGTWNPRRITHWRLVPSPVAGDGVILACAPKRDPVYAVAAGGEGELDYDEGLLWSSEERSPVTSDVPTPAFKDGVFYVLSDVRKALSAVDATSGEVLWSVEVPGQPMAWASPTLAGGRIYFQNLLGDVFIYNTEDGELLNRIEFSPDQNEIRSTIAIAGDDLFIRNNTHLYRVGD